MIFLWWVNGRVIECFASMRIGLLLLLLMRKARTQREMEIFTECNYSSASVFNLVSVYMT